MPPYPRFFRSSAVRAGLLLALGLAACDDAPDPAAPPAPTPPAPEAPPTAPDGEGAVAATDGPPGGGQDGGLELDVDGQGLPAGSINPARFELPALDEPDLGWFLNNRAAPKGGAAQVVESVAGPQVLEIRRLSTGKKLSTAVRTVQPGEKISVAVAEAAIKCEGCTVL